MKRRKFTQYESIDEQDHNDAGEWGIVEQVGDLNHYALSAHDAPVIFEGMVVTETGAPSDHVLVPVGYGVQVDGSPLIQDGTISATIDVDCSAGAPNDYGHIEIRYYEYSHDNQNRTFVDALGATSVAAVDKTVTSQIEAQYVFGGAGGCAGITAGWVKIAEVKQVGATIVNADIKNVDATFAGIANTGWTADTTATLRIPAYKKHRDTMDHALGTVSYTHCDTALQALIADTAATVERQAIVNGDFDFWQRGTAFSPVTGAFTADRWYAYENVTGCTMALNRGTGVPTELQSGHKSTYEPTFTTSAQAAPGAAESAFLRYCVEGYDFAQLKGKTVTLSFWVLSGKTGTYCVTFQNAAANRSWIMEYTVLVANTWEKKTLSIALTEPTGVWDIINGTGLRIYWMLAAGANYLSTTGAWQASDVRATASQVAWTNFNVAFAISQVQLNTGASAYPFTRRPIPDELEACQRYYEKSYDVAVVPDTVTTVGQWSGYYADAGATANGVAWSLGQHPRFKVRKRATTPAVLIYNPGGGPGAGARWDVSGSRASVAINISEVGFEVANNVGAPATPGVGPSTGHWTADSELA